MGSARLRQLRVKTDSCQIASSVLHLVPDCEAPYAWDVEDMGSYEPGWNQSLETNYSSVPSPWRYQTEAQLRSHPVWGRMGMYRGGGFVVELGPNKQNASRYVERFSKLKHMCYCNGAFASVSIDYIFYKRFIKIPYYSHIQIFVFLNGLQWSSHYYSSKIL